MKIGNSFVALATGNSLIKSVLDVLGSTLTLVVAALFIITALVFIFTANGDNQKTRIYKTSTLVIIMMSTLMSVVYLIGNNKSLDKQPLLAVLEQLASPFIYGFVVWLASLLIMWFIIKEIWCIQNEVMLNTEYKSSLKPKIVKKVVLKCPECSKLCPEDSNYCSACCHAFTLEPTARRETSRRKRHGPI